LAKKKKKIPRQRREVVDFVTSAPKWPECEVVANPVKTAGEPITLVRRRQSGLVGPDGEELVYFADYPTISLFTGVGGFDLGIEQAGFECVVQHEWEQSACETLIVNRPQFFTNAALIQGDIRLTPTSRILEEANLRVGEPYLLIGGPPCQGFSTAGKRAPEDLRNDLVFQFLRVVNEARPRHFIMENVPGFLSFNKGEYFRRYLLQAYNCYYELVYGLINAAEYGVPQYRTRFICAGTRRDIFEIEGILSTLPHPQTFDESDLKLIELYESAPLFHQRDLDLLTHPPGIRYFPDREVLVPPWPVHRGRDAGTDEKITGRSKKFIEFYRKLYRDEPDRIPAPANG
jgi:site-specific DNA-cytosine methylase